MEPLFIDGIGLLLFIAGFVVGLGAVTVIDIHGLLGTRSPYWSEATTRTHKVTKPLIWLGITLAVVGGILTYRHLPLAGVPLAHFVIALALIMNGWWLSFRVSPFLLAREREGKASELLPASWQRKIAVSFVVSVIGWWGALILLVYHIVTLS
jgi:hypothetical protein